MGFVSKASAKGPASRTRRCQPERERVGSDQLLKIRYKYAFASVLEPILATIAPTSPPLDGLGRLKVASQVIDHLIDGP